MIEQRTSDCGAPGWVMYRRRMVFLPQTELLIAFRSVITTRPKVQHGTGHHCVSSRDIDLKAGIKEFEK